MASVLQRSTPELAADTAERWLSRKMLEAGFSTDFAREHSHALKGSIRTRPEDLAKMRDDLSALAGA